MIGNPSRHGGRILATVVCLAAISAAACSSGSHSAKSTTTTTVDGPTTSTTTPEEGAVIAAWRHYWDVYVAVGSEMKLPDPRLAQVATGEELRQLGGAFLAAKSDGEVFRGTIDLRPRVVSVTGTSAELRDCYFSHILGYDAATNQPKGSELQERRLVTATLVLESGTWKVSAIRHESDGCTEP